MELIIKIITAFISAYLLKMVPSGSCTDFFCKMRPQKYGYFGKQGRMFFNYVAKEREKNNFPNFVRNISII